VENYNGKLIAEDEYAYDVTLRLARMLISNGAKVYMK
jgi:N-acetylmuramoyl-L-alanine amidase